MKKSLSPFWSVWLVIFLIACGDKEPTLEQEDPNYRYFLDDGRRVVDDVAPTPDLWEEPSGDVAALPDLRRATDVPPVVDLVEAPDYLSADVGCIPGTKCYEDDWKIMGSTVIINMNEEAYNPDWYLFDVLPPASKTITFSIKSSGFNQLNLVDVFLAPGGNPAISMEWTSPGLPASLPQVLQPGESVAGKLHYQPNDTTPSNPAVFTVWSSDPDHLERTVLLKPKEQGPDIVLPISAVNYGCGNYCFGQDFSVENAGNKDLVIQSTSFEKASGEWTADAPGPGTTLSPKGSPGYSPLLLSLSYCDTDGNYSNDSNVFQIFSNDPDENPAKIHLNVMLPDGCP